MGLRVTDERLQEDHQLADFNGKNWITTTPSVSLNPAYRNKLFLILFLLTNTFFFMSRSSDRVRGAKQPSRQVYGDDAVGQGALPFGTGQHAAPRLQDKKH